MNFKETNEDEINTFFLINNKIKGKGDASCMSESAVVNSLHLAQASVIFKKKEKKKNFAFEGSV